MTVHVVVPGVSRLYRLNSDPVDYLRHKVRVDPTGLQPFEWNVFSMDGNNLNPWTRVEPWWRPSTLDAVLPAVCRNLIRR